VIHRRIARVHVFGCVNVYIGGVEGSSLYFARASVGLMLRAVSLLLLS
jgi:hypothetical protein